MTIIVIIAIGFVLLVSVIIVLVMFTKMRYNQTGILGSGESTSRCCTTLAELLVTSDVVV